MSPKGGLKKNRTIWALNKLTLTLSKAIDVVKCNYLDKHKFIARFKSCLELKPIESFQDVLQNRSKLLSLLMTIRALLIGGIRTPFLGQLSVAAFAVFVKGDIQFLGVSLAL